MRSALKCVYVKMRTLWKCVYCENGSAWKYVITTERVKSCCYNYNICTLIWEMLCIILSLDHLFDHYFVIVLLFYVGSNVFAWPVIHFVHPHLEPGSVLFIK